MQLTWLVTWALLGLLTLGILALVIVVIRMKKSVRDLNDDIITVDREVLKLEGKVKANETATIALQRGVVDLRGRTNPQLPVVRPAVPHTTPFAKVVSEQPVGRHSSRRSTKRPRPDMPY